MLRQNLGHRVTAMMARSAFLQHSKMPPPQTASVVKYTSNGILSSRNILKIEPEESFCCFDSPPIFFSHKKFRDTFRKKNRDAEKWIPTSKIASTTFCHFRLFAATWNRSSAVFFRARPFFRNLEEEKKLIFKDILLKN